MDRKSTLSLRLTLVSDANIIDPPSITNYYTQYSPQQCSRLSDTEIITPKIWKNRTRNKSTPRLHRDDIETYSIRTSAKATMNILDNTSAI